MRRDTKTLIIGIVLVLLGISGLVYIVQRGHQEYQAEQNHIVQVKKNEVKKYGRLQSQKTVTKKEFLEAFNVADKHNNKELLNKINGLEVYDPKSKHHYITHTDYRKNNSNYSLTPID